MFADDAVAGKATLPGSLQRNLLTQVGSILAKQSQASLGQLAVAAILGRYASIGGAIDAIRMSGVAAETYITAYAKSIGLETFLVQRSNGTGFDLITARANPKGGVSDVMVLDVKNTSGVVDSVTALGAGSKRPGNYAGNVATAIDELLTQQRLGSRYAGDVAAALDNRNFGVGIVAHSAATISADVTAAILARTGKQVKFLPWL
jgi:hypothetical protein